MRRYCLAFTLGCIAVSASVGCNSILGNDDGFLATHESAVDGSAATPDMTSSGPTTDTQDDTDAAAAWDAFAPTGSTPDASTTDAGQSVDAGATSGKDAGSGATTDAGGCSGTLVRCGLFCVDLQSDALHCGTCSTVCLAPPTCKNGQCKHP